MLLVELDGEALKQVDSLAVPRAVEMIRIGRAPLAEVIAALEALPPTGLFDEHLPWLEVRVLLDEPLPDLRQRIETAITGKACRLVRIASEYAGKRGETESEVLLGLDQITRRNCSPAPGKNSTATRRMNRRWMISPRCCNGSSSPIRRMTDENPRHPPEEPGVAGR